MKFVVETAGGTEGREKGGGGVKCDFNIRGPFEETHRLFLNRLTEGTPPEPCLLPPASIPL